MTPFFSQRLSIALIINMITYTDTLNASPLLSEINQSAFLEMEQCADCHPQQTQGFLETGMGRSLISSKEAKVIENFEWERQGNERQRVARFVHPQTQVLYQVIIDHQGRWWQSERFRGEEKRVEILYMIGSGTHTRSYIGAQDGVLVELPLTWYQEKKRWDMSPGYEGANHSRFQRLITPECLFCHNDLQTTQTQVSLSSRSTIPLGISCRRCHGNGQAHIQAQLSGTEPGEIVNPAKMDFQRQMQLCQQCHLAGATRGLYPEKQWQSYHIQEPLEEHFVVYGYDELKPQNKLQNKLLHTSQIQFGIASHAERLAMSKCAQQAQLGCTQCHDPHQKAQAKDYDQACQGCHQSTPHRNMQSKMAEKQSSSFETLTGCVACHMKRDATSDIPHVHFTDHWIRTSIDQPEQNPGTSQPDEWDLKPLTSIVQEPSMMQLMALKALTQVALHGEREGGIVKAQKYFTHWAEQIERLAIHHQREFLFAAHIDLVSYGKNLSLQLLKSDSFVQYASAQLYRASLVARTLIRQADHKETEPRLLLNLGEKILKEALKIGEGTQYDQIQAKVILADLLQIKGSFKEAEHLYLSVNQESTDDLIGLLNLSALYLSQARWQEANLWAEKAQQRDPISPLPHYRKSLIHLAQNQLPDALQSIQHMLDRCHETELLSEGFVIQLELAQALNMLTLATDSLKQLIILEPDAQHHYERLSELHWRQGQTQQSLLILQTAAKRFKDHHLNARVRRLEEYLKNSYMPKEQGILSP